MSRSSSVEGRRDIPAGRGVEDEFSAVLREDTEMFFCDAKSHKERDDGA